MKHRRGSVITKHRKAGVIAVAGVSAACAFGALAAPASAAASTFKDHETMDVTGSVFACQQGDLTVTSGSVSETVEGVQDGTGIFHITGTVVPHNVILTDGTNTYTISGAAWFGGKTTAPDDPNVAPIEFTDTEHFVIHSASGGVYAKVQLVTHISPSGLFFSFDRGSCEPPND